MYTAYMVYEALDVDPAVPIEPGWPPPLDLQDAHRAGPGLEPGTWFGRYIILDRLGRGGMGVVYGAYDTELERRVALKLSRADIADTASGYNVDARLFREARYMAAVDHPWVAVVHDAGRHEGRAFVAMDYVEGRSLSRWAKEDRPWRERAEVVMRGGVALAAAHAAGIVHRDFKPDNLLVMDDGEVRLIDFGLARENGTAGPGRPPTAVRPEVDDRVTYPGLVMGTPAYMAPEQGVGMDVDPSMDQFAFCVTLYETLYGHRPFEGKGRQELCAAALSGLVREPASLDGVPTKFHAALLKGLAAQPEARWPDLSALLGRLRSIIQPRLRWFSRSALEPRRRVG